MNQKYLDIVEQERLYFKTVKDFTEVGLYVVVLSLFVQHCYGRRDNKKKVSDTLRSLSIRKIKRCLSEFVVTSTSFTPETAKSRFDIVMSMTPV